MFDRSAPLDLIELQKWFSNALKTPYYSVTSDDEANHHVTSKTLPGVELYNNHVWKRNIVVLAKFHREIFKKLGSYEFNCVAIDYLTDCPPHHFDYKTCFESFPTWFSRKYP